MIPGLFICTDRRDIRHCIGAYRWLSNDINILRILYNLYIALHISIRSHKSHSDAIIKRSRASERMQELKNPGLGLDLLCKSVFTDRLTGRVMLSVLYVCVCVCERWRLASRRDSRTQSADYCTEQRRWVCQRSPAGDNWQTGTDQSSIGRGTYYSREAKCCFGCQLPHHSQPAIERVQALADISRSALYAFAVYKAISLHTCIVIATKPVHRLQIHPIMHN